ncbi:MAG: glycine--tRNA ligase subunit beta, partial [Terriglobia bacterium]
MGRNLAPREQDRVEEIIGPPKSVALDASGKPTQAGEGFARKQGLRWQDLKEVATPKGTYMAAVRRTKGRAMDVVLRELVPRVIRRIEFPRTMYWTSPEGLRFVRPIRWLVVLWNGKAVKMELEGVRSGGASWGHRLLANSQVPLRGVDSYQPRLKKASVLVAPAARQRKIEREMAGALRRKGLRLKPDAELLRLVVNLTEYPSVVLGSFDARFLSLPKEVLVTVMRHHQRYFSVADKRGRLAPKFIAVIDQEHDRDGRICRGHESVLEARFRDAEFFWQADQKLTLEARRSLLAYVTFVSGAGNYGQKVARLQKLVLWLAQHLGEEGSSTDKHATQCRRADMKATMRAASLCKSDLTTEMVRELPELQGVCGGLYARAQKENPLVADAIYEHYRPRGPAEPIPASAEGAVLALADKLDSLAACFSVRLLPTGSQDPFALRRAGTGVVRLLVEGNLAVPLAAALQHSLALVREQGIGVKGQDSTPELRSFLGDRASHYFR